MRSRDLALAALLVTVLFGTAAYPDDQLPPDIQALVDKKKSGQPLTPDEEKRLEGYATSSLDGKVGGLTRAEVTALLEKLRSGDATSGDVGRLRAWAVEASGKAELARDLSAVLEALRASGGAKDRRPPGKVDLDFGTVHVRSSVHTTVTERGSQETTESSLHLRFEAAYKVHYAVEERNGLARITWMPDLRRAADLLCEGSLSVSGRTTHTGPASSTVSTVSATLPFAAGAEQGATIVGEVVAPLTSGARAWLTCTASTGATRDLTSHIVEQGPDEVQERDETKPFAVAPGGQLSLDDMNPETLLRMGLMGAMPKASRSGVFEQLPSSLQQAATTARCDWSAAEWKRRRTAGQAFRSAADCRYRLTMDETSDDTTKQTTVVAETRFELEFGPTAADLELVPLSAAEYARWLPRPYTDDPIVEEAFGVGKNDPSVRLGFTLRFKAREGDASPKGRIRVELTEVSRNKGVCANYPIEGAAEEPGLFFPAEGQPPGLEVDGRGQTATTTGEVSEVTVYVAARDAGAYGRLVASCEERGVVAEFVPTHRDFAAIPKDTSGQRLPDAWEPGRGRAPTEDNDARNGQRSAGDGLTAYEEYRGFIELVQSGEDTYKVRHYRHSRTSPQRKDVFCLDADGLMLRYYLGPNPAEVVWHLVDEKTMKFTGVETDALHRWINPNTPDAYRYAPRQYGAVVVRDDGPPRKNKDGSITSGGYTPRSDSRDCRRWPIRDGFECRIYTASTRDTCRPYLTERPKPGKNRFADEGQWLLDGKTPERRAELSKAMDEHIDNQIAMTVIHEMGHYLGINHHRDRDDGQAYNDGGWLGSVYWGPLDCVLRYDGEVVDGPIFRRAQPIPRRTRYCRAGDVGKWPSRWEEKKTRVVDGVEYLDFVIVTEYVTAPSTTKDCGCWEQIQVKTDP